MSFIKELDTNLFLWLNAYHNQFFDVFMWRISATATWIPLYLCIIAYLFVKQGWKNALAIILVYLVSLGLADFIASGIIKNLVCRYRPSHNLHIQVAVHVVKGYHGGLYGFVSSHAANTMAIATVSYYFIRKRWLGITMLLWSFTVTYSRIYLGVHYPLDILGGFAVGLLSATIVVYSYIKVKPLLCHKK